MDINEVAQQVSDATTEIAANAWLVGGNFLLLIILTTAILFLAMRKGGAGLISVNISLYVGYAIYIVFPYRDAIIGIGATPFIQAIISVGIFILLTAIPFVTAFRLTEPSFGSLNLVQGFFLSLAASLFLMALGYHVFDLSNIYSFSEPLNQLFEPQGYFFYWFIAPIVGLFFLAR